MNEQWILCLGAGSSQLPLIKRAKLLGYKVLAIDKNHQSPGLFYADEKIIESTHNSDAIISKLKGRVLNGLLARSSGKALFTAAIIAKEFNIPGVNCEIAKIATSKSALREFSLNNDIKVPYGSKVSSDHMNNINESVDYVVVKPDFTLVGKKAISKVKVTNKKEVNKVIQLALSSSGNEFVEIEEYVEGYDCSYLSWVKNGVSFNLLSWDEINIFDKNSNLFQLGISMPSISSINNHSKEIEKVITKFAKLFPNVCTLLAFSFRVDKNGTPWLIEVHADLTGDQILDKLAPVATNCDCLLEIIKLLVNKDNDLSSCLKKFTINNPTALIHKNKKSNIADDIVFCKDDIILLHEEINKLAKDHVLDQKKFISRKGVL